MVHWSEELSNGVQLTVTRNEDAFISELKLDGPLGGDAHALTADLTGKEKDEMVKTHKLLGLFLYKNSNRQNRDDATLVGVMVAVRSWMTSEDGEEEDTWDKAMEKKEIEDKCYILALRINNNYQGWGAASLLLGKWGIPWVRDSFDCAGGVFLDVSAGNALAINMYTSMEFEKKATVRHDDGEESHVMVKSGFNSAKPKYNLPSHLLAKKIPGILPHDEKIGFQRRLFVRELLSAKVQLPPQVEQLLKARFPGKVNWGWNGEVAAVAGLFAISYADRGKMGLIAAIHLEQHLVSEGGKNHHVFTAWYAEHEDYGCYSLLPWFLTECLEPWLLAAMTKGQPSGDDKASAVELAIPISIRDGQNLQALFGGDGEEGQSKRGYGAGYTLGGVLNQHHGVIRMGEGEEKEWLKMETKRIRSALKTTPHLPHYKWRKEMEGLGIEGAQIYHRLLSGHITAGTSTITTGETVEFYIGAKTLKEA